MRANILLVVVIVICIAGLIRPRIGLYGYIWFSLMRPDAAAFAAGRFNMAQALAVVTLVGTAWHFINFRQLLKPLPVMLILFEFVIALSANSAVLPDYAWAEFYRYLRMMVMCLTIPVLITEEKHFRELFLVSAASLGFLGLWWGATAGIRGMRIWYGPGGFMGDNNSFAIALVMIVPFCWQTRSILKKPWAKPVFTAMLVGSVVAIILTYSRGGFVALAVTILLLIFRSQNRARTAVVLLLAVIPVLGMVGASYKQRLATIDNYEEDASAMSRLVQIEIAYEMWKQRPMLGVGIGDQNYLIASRPYLTRGEPNLIVHNSFMQVLVHTGIFSFLLYVAMLLTALHICWRTGWRRWKTDREGSLYPIAIFVALTGYVIGSLTHPRAWFDFFYMLLMYASVWNDIAKKRRATAAALAQPNVAKAPAQWRLPQPAAVARFQRT